MIFIIISTQGTFGIAENTSMKDACPIKMAPAQNEVLSYSSSVVSPWQVPGVLVMWILLITLRIQIFLFKDCEMPNHFSPAEICFSISIPFH